MTRWLAETAVGGRHVFRVGRDGDVLVAEWAGLGTLTVNRDGSQPSFRAVASADHRLLEKIEAGTMRALLRHVRGDLSLHAACVESQGIALAFVGSSGSGKSTLAFALANAADAQFAILSDDCLSVDHRTAQPTEGAGWIEQNGRAKAPVRPRRIATHGAPLRAVMTLTYSERISLRRLRGAEAAGALGQAMIRFVLDEPDVHRADLERLAELAKDIFVLELARPRGIDHLPETIARIEKLSSVLAGSPTTRDDLEARILEE